MSVVIGVREAYRRLEEVVTETGPDYKYPDSHRDGRWCQYYYEGKPDCIIGRAFSDLISKDTRNAAAENVLAGYLTKGAVLVVAAAQSVQDNGGAWGLALTVAERIKSVAGYQLGLD